MFKIVSKSKWESLNNEIAEGKKLIVSISKENKEMWEKKNALTESHIELSKKLDTCTETKVQLKREIEKLHGSNKGLQDKLDESEADRKRQNTVLMDKNKEISELRQRIQKNSNVIEELRASDIDLTGKVEVLKSNNEKTVQALNAVLTELNKTKGRKSARDHKLVGVIQTALHIDN